MKTWGTMLLAVVAACGLVAVGCDKKKDDKKGKKDGKGDGGGGGDFGKATALSFLEAATKKAGGDAKLVRITISGLKEDGTVDLTKSLVKGGGSLQYQFLVGDKGKLVNYIGVDHQSDPMINAADWDLTGAKAISADDVKKLKDTPDLAKKAKDAGVVLGKQDSSVSYYIRVDKPEAQFGGGGKAAGFNAVTGDKVN